MVQQNAVAPEYLKQISRIKHRILGGYFSPWTVILGSHNPQLAYADCFAGSGLYQDETGQHLPGSPLMCLQLARTYGLQHPTKQLLLAFVEKNHRLAAALGDVLGGAPALPPNVRFQIHTESAQDFVERLVAGLGATGNGIVPTFFFVDPFGHPITVPIMRRLLALGQTELLVNLMWFRINMDLSNPLVQANVDTLFGHDHWRAAPFMSMRGGPREREFLRYFIGELGAKFSIPFPFPYSPEDEIAGGATRTKFYLVHFSNHPKAATLMKQVMWTAREAVESLERGDPTAPRQLTLFADQPADRVDLTKLRDDLLSHFTGRRIAFEDIEPKTIEWDYIEKHYRQVILGLETAGVVQVERISSKRRGLKGKDMVRFP